MIQIKSFPKTKFPIFILGILASLFFVQSLSFSKEEIDFEATVDRATMELGSYLTLTLTIKGVQGAAPIELPSIEGFQSRYVGPATRISIINGQVSHTISFTYNLYPVKTGKFQIPAITTTVDGKNLSSQPIEIEVVDAGKLPPSPDSGEGGADPVSLKDKIFIIMGAEKRDYYLNEKIPLTIKLFVNGVSVRDIQYPEFEHNGFIVDPFSEPERHQQNIGGILYDVIEFRTSVYPTRTGELGLGPAKLSCNILFRRSTKKHPLGDDFDRFFDEDFFDNFFDTFDLRTANLESVPLGLNILPLPEEGKPKDFSGGVGQFQFEMSVSPSEVKVGDPITVRMRISGDGNLKAIRFPQIEEQENLKLYEPQIKEEEGAVVLEQVVIPKSEKITQLPSLSFGFFDSQEGKYQTVTQGPFPIKVTPLEAAEGLKIIGIDQSKEPQDVKGEELGQDIVFIKDQPGHLQPKGFRIYKSLPFLMGVVMGILIWVSLFISYKISYRMKTDLKFARKLQAPRHARKGIKEARSFLEKNNQQQFYDSLFKTLQNYFSHKFHLPVGTITYQTIEDTVKVRAAKDSVLEKIKTIFDECEMVRYASGELDLSNMKSSLQRLEEIIDFFERNWS